MSCDMVFKIPYIGECREEYVRAFTKELLIVNEIVFRHTNYNIWDEDDSLDDFVRREFNHITDGWIIHDLVLPRYTGSSVSGAISHDTLINLTDEIRSEYTDIIAFEVTTDQYVASTALFTEVLSDIIRYIFIRTSMGALPSTYKCEQLRDYVDSTIYSYDLVPGGSIELHDGRICYTPKAP